MNIITIYVLYCLIFNVYRADITTNHIKTREEIFVNLNKDHQCATYIYYSLKNCDSENAHDTINDSDLIIILNNGNNPTTIISVYQINLNDDNSEDVRLFSASSKEIIVYSFQRNYAKTIKIIFCDYIYSFKDHFYIIDEKEPFQLRENQPIFIDKFYHLNQFTFEFTNVVKEHIQYEIQIKNTNKNTNTHGKIDIFYNKLSTLPLYSSQEFFFNKVIALKPEELIYITIINDDHILFDNVIFILISKYDPVTVLFEDQTNKKYIIRERCLYYYINLDKYNTNDEGIVTFYLSNTKVIDNNILTVAYAKIIKGDLNNSNLPKPILKEENEFKWEQDNNSYYIRIRNNSMSDKTFILLYFEFKGNWFQPFILRVSHSKIIQKLVISNKTNRLVFKARKYFFYYYNIVFGHSYINKTFVIQTFSSYQYTLTIVNNNKNSSNSIIRRQSIYKSIIPEESCLTIKYSTQIHQDISFVIVIPFKPNLIYSINLLSDLYNLMNKPIDCFDNLFFFVSDFSLLNKKEKKSFSPTNIFEEFDIYPIDSITSINNNFNEMNMEINNHKYNPILIYQLSMYHQKILLIQCKKHYSKIKLNISLIAKDFSIELKWNQSKHNITSLYNIYLVKKVSHFAQSIDIPSKLNTKPYNSITTKRTSHLIYPIKPGYYSLLVISLTQLNNTIIIKENHESLIFIPAIFSTSITILLIMMFLLLILFSLLIFKTKKAKEE